MRRATITIVTTVVALWVAAGCSAVTDPVEIDEFRWSPLADPETRVSVATSTSALSLLYIQGVLTTPSPCYGLSSDFQKDGEKLTLLIDARPTSGTNCDSGPGAFEYTGVITNLKRRTYDLRVVHDVQGGDGDEFNLTVSVVQ